MAKTAKQQVEGEDLRQQIEFFCIEKGLEFEEVMDAINKAISGAYRREFGERDKTYEAEFDLASNSYKVYEAVRVVEEVENEMREMSLMDAKLENPDAKMDDVIRHDMGVEKEVGFGRIASQVAKQVLIYTVNNIQHTKVLDKFKDHVGQIVGVEVDAFKKGGYIVKLGQTTGFIPREELLPTDRFKPGQMIKALIVDITDDPARGSRIHLSRTNNDFIVAIIKQEVPEVASGLVKIDKLVREPGNRTKLLVSVNEEDENAADIDPVGSILGRRNVRILNIMREISTSLSEKVDVVENNPEDFEQMIVDALEPAEIQDLEFSRTDDDKELVIVYCRAEEASLAVGRRGANVRLASRLLDIEIKVQSIDVEGSSSSEE